MNRPFICLTLSGKTIAENVATAKKYKEYVDMYELRSDFLEEDELFEIRRFPSLLELPVILTIRRQIDGGKYRGGEASRTMLFARAMAFTDKNPKNNFAYVDFEEDFYVPSLQEAAMAFGTKIIRSLHNMEGTVKDIPAMLSKMRRTGYEIPKIACTPHSLSDVTEIFRECKSLKEFDHIVTAMGHLGFPTRLLSLKLHSYLTFVSPPDAEISDRLGHIDPISINELYHFKDINSGTKIYGITGWPLDHTSSPNVHNAGYVKHGINAVYIPVASKNIGETFDFATETGMNGFSVTVPHKESAIAYLTKLSAGVQKIGACNTVVKESGCWAGYNTDAAGFKRALFEFFGTDNMKGKRAAIIGAGGAAKAVAYVLNELGIYVCVLNRTVSRAKSLAEQYGFSFAPLAPESCQIVEHYGDIIIQTTSKGMGEEDGAASTEENDPLWFYKFTGREVLMDIVYCPETTPVMMRAKSAGCRVSNGMAMLHYQGYEQFRLFSKVEY